MNDVPERKSYRLAYTTLAVACVVLVVTGIVVFLVLAGNSTSSDIRESTKRADCRTAYNADFTEVVRTRDALVAEGLVAVAQGDRARLAAIAGDVDQANRAVQRLPKLDDAVEHGYTLNGVHHPPCPG